MISDDAISETIDVVIVGDPIFEEPAVGMAMASSSIVAENLDSKGVEDGCITLATDPPDIGQFGASGKGSKAEDNPLTPTADPEFQEQHGGSNHTGQGNNLWSIYESKSSKKKKG